MDGSIILYLYIKSELFPYVWWLYNSIVYDGSFAIECGYECGHAKCS